MVKRPFFSIIVVCLNPGEKLEQTLVSVKRQKFQDYEVIIKDGQSGDGAVEAWQEYNKDERFRVFVMKDSGIYDAMNQGVAHSKGRFVYFLNCGDYLYDDGVLERVGEKLKEGERGTETGAERILYGDILSVLTGQKIASNPRLDRFGCYRNVPNHQACFYERKLLSRHPFRTEFLVRADYEHFLYCFLAGRAVLEYLPVTIAGYEGGGFSESGANRKRSAREHKVITGEYMSKKELFLYKGILLLTLAPLRTLLAESKVTSAFYQHVKRALYRKK